MSQPVEAKPDNKPAISDIARLMGQTPSGVFIITANISTNSEPGALQPVGMMGSWVQQVSFEPLRLSLAIHPERALFGALEASKACVLNLVAKDRPTLMRAFGRQSDDPFSSLETEPSEAGPLLKDAIGALQCKVQQIITGVGDHYLVILEPYAAHLYQQGQIEPFVHIRNAATHY